METWKAKTVLKKQREGVMPVLRAFESNYRTAVMNSESHTAHSRQTNRTETESELPFPDIGGHGKQWGHSFQRTVLRVLYIQTKSKGDG